MTDIYSALAIMVLLSVMLFFIALWMTQKAPNWLRDLLGLVTIAAIGFYIRDVWDHVFVADWLPYSSLIVLGNWFPLFAGFLGGIVWQRVPGSALRKSLFVVAPCLAALYALVVPIRGLPPECSNEWRNGVCLQSSQATCSAASAATMLSAYGIATTEQEMAELCLTRQGTHWQGLYRGLKLKTADTRWDVEVFESNIEDLQSLSDGPMILNLELKKDTDFDPVYVKKWGWIPGVPHSAVLLGFRPDGRIEMGDPSNGRELWSWDDMKVLWHGQGFRLVERETPAES